MNSERQKDEEEERKRKYAEMHEFYLRDESLRCTSCGSDDVMYKHITERKEGFAKADIWGNKDRESLSRAQCQTCKHEWDFETL